MKHEVFLVVCIMTLFCSTAYAQTIAEEETFITDCAIWLFGNEVPPRSHAGQVGFLVRKSSAGVTINDVLYVGPALSTGQASIVTHPHVPSSDPVEETIRELWVGIERIDRDTIRFNRTDYSEGDTLYLQPVGTSDTVCVYVGEAFFVLRHNGKVTTAPIDKPEVISLDEYNERLINSVYLNLTGRLHPGSLLIAGRGYQHTYPIEELDSVKASLSLLRARAADEAVRRNGIRIGGYYWNSQVVKEFAESRGD